MMLMKCFFVLLLLAVVAYAETTYEWSLIEAMPTARSDLTATTVDGSVYVAGGCIVDNSVQYGHDMCTEITNRVEVLHVESRTWSSTTPMSEPRTRHAATEMNGKLYVFGGRPAGNDFNKTLTSVERFDPETGKWVFIEPLPVGISDFGAASFVDDEGVSNLIVVGGWSTDYSVAFDTTWQYSESSNKWTKIGKLLQGRGDVVVANNNEEIFAVGGFALDERNNIITRNTIEKFNSETLTWEAFADLGVARGDKAVGFINDYLVAIGGESFVNNISYTHNDIEFVSAKGTVVPIGGKRPPRLSAPRMRFAATSHENAIYVFGGHSHGKRVLDMVECFFSATDATEDNGLYHYSVENIMNIHDNTISLLNVVENTRHSAAEVKKVLNMVQNSTAEIKKVLDTKMSRSEANSVFHVLLYHLKSLQRQVQNIEGRPNPNSGTAIANAAMVMAFFWPIFVCVIYHYLLRRFFVGKDMLIGS